jgi:hypothetical protein
MALSPDPTADPTPKHDATRLAPALRRKVGRAGDAPNPPRVIWVHRIDHSSVIHSIWVVRERTVVRTHAGRSARPAVHAPPTFPPPFAPSSPAGFAPVAGGAPGSGSFTPLALASGILGAFLLTFLAYATPELQIVRPRPAEADPDPPG